MSSRVTKFCQTKIFHNGRYAATVNASIHALCSRHVLPLQRKTPDQEFSALELLP